MSALDKVCRLVGLITFCWSAWCVKAQELHSVVKDAQTEIIVRSETQGSEKQSRTIMVLDSQGEDAAWFFCDCDMFRSLQKFSGEIMDASGKVVRRIKKSELQKSEYSYSLMTDDYFYYYKCDYPSYPFTVKYEWTVKHGKGFAGYPAFRPQTEYGQRVEKATYSLLLPEGQVCRTRLVNVGKEEIKVSSRLTPEGRLLVEAEARLLPPLSSELWGLSASELFPMLYLAPASFVLDGSQGDMSTWKEYGKWQYGLLEGRDALSEEQKSKVREIVAGCQASREKVRALYDYLGKHTRYVSIQLGLGGFQPIAAEEVWTAGFGDCKGLTNLLKAMLKEAGIPSTYVTINTYKESLLHDFSNASQMNHAILQVPLREDTLWLECTNPRLPLGFLHSGIAGHEALLVEETGGRLCRLPSYPDSLNSRQVTASIDIEPDGKAVMKVREASSLFFYEDRAGLLALEPDRQMDAARSGIALQRVILSNLKMHEEKTAVPFFLMSYQAQTQYGHKTGNRLFLPVNVFQQPLAASKEERRQPVCIDKGYVYADSLHYRLPEGYVVEKMYEPVRIETPFGRFESFVNCADERNMSVVQHLLVRKGRYAAEDYAAFLDFLQKVAGQYGEYIILRKE